MLVETGVSVPLVGAYVCTVLVTVLVRQAAALEWTVRLYVILAALPDQY